MRRSARLGFVDRRLGEASDKRVPADRAEELERLYRERYLGFRVHLDEILCVEEERQVGHDNCVSCRTLKLQSRRARSGRASSRGESRPHGSYALVHGLTCH